MAIKIIKSFEAMKIKNINIMIYGQPGIGKTSFAFTSQNPLLIDFDGLAAKAGNRKDIMIVNNWESVISITADDIESYDTIIVDTIGKAQDYCMDFIMRHDPKSRTKSGGLSISGWGSLKFEFLNWIKKINLMGKDVVFIAHDKEEQAGDVSQKRPIIAGSAAGAITADVMLMGYMQVVNKQRLITFKPDDNYFTKNVGDLEDVIFGDLVTNQTILADIIQKVKQSISDSTVEGIELSNQYNEYKIQIDNIKDVNEMNLFYSNLELNPKIEKIVKMLIKNKVEDLGLTFNKEKKEFEC